MHLCHAREPEVEATLGLMASALAGFPPLAERLAALGEAPSPPLSSLLLEGLSVETDLPGGLGRGTPRGGSLCCLGARRGWVPALRRPPLTCTCSADGGCSCSDKWSAAAAPSGQLQQQPRTLTLLLAPQI